MLFLVKQQKRIVSGGTNKQIIETHTNIIRKRGCYVWVGRGEQSVIYSTIPFATAGSTRQSFGKGDSPSTGPLGTTEKMGCLPRGSSEKPSAPDTCVLTGVYSHGWREGEGPVSPSFSHQISQRSAMLVCGCKPTVPVAQPGINCQPHSRA